MSHLIQHKLEFVLVFIGSWSFGHLFADNAKPIGTFVGAIISTIVVKLLEWGLKKLKAYCKKDKKTD